MLLLLVLTRLAQNLPRHATADRHPRKVQLQAPQPEARAEAVQNVVANTWVALVALARRGKLDLAYPTVLARYGVAQTRDFRVVGGHLHIKDVLSPYCQAKKSVKVERLDRFDDEENAWQEAVVQDTRTAPVPETVSFRVDFANWLASLPRRNRRIAETLAWATARARLRKGLR